MKLQKETESHGKWYQDACGTAFAMELVGERWSILIIRELMLGGRRFSDLRASLPGISAKVLAERLAGLEAARVLVRRKLRSVARVDQTTAVRRLSGMLARKGYPAGVAFRVVREELDAAGRDTDDLLDGGDPELS